MTTLNFQIEHIKLPITEIKHHTYSVPKNHIYFAAISPLEEQNISLRGLHSCKAFVHDDLRHVWFHSNKSSHVFKEKAFRIFVGFNKNDSKKIELFLKNFTWFKAWQQHLNLKEPIIFETFLDKNEIKIPDTQPITSYFLKQEYNNKRFLIEVDPIWQQGILQNSFLTYILRCMTQHEFKTPINFSDFAKDLNPSDLDYYKKMGKDIFLYYLNNIHKLISEKPFGNKEDDFWEYHDSYGIANQACIFKHTAKFKEFKSSFLKEV